MADDAAARQATDEITACIALVKTANPNPYGDDDEAIAGEILRQIDERKTKVLPQERQR